MGNDKTEDNGWDDEEDAEKDELCNCRFSLAYGGKILLNGATLRLIRGRRYGLCGANGAGKSTLMRAIAKGQLDGFPSPDHLKTVYVEHDIQVGPYHYQQQQQQGFIWLPGCLPTLIGSNCLCVIEQPFKQSFLAD